MRPENIEQLKSDILAKKRRRVSGGASSVSGATTSASGTETPVFLFKTTKLAEKGRKVEVEIDKKTDEREVESPLEGVTQAMT